jgi:hypothetical protein
LKEYDLETEVNLLLDYLQEEGPYWQLRIVKRMLDEMCRMERIINPSWYWSKEYLGIEDV